MEKGESMVIAILIKNSVSLICWVALAIYFDKWWIALFSVFFMASWETNKLYYRVCDECERHSPAANDHNKAIDLAIEAGWIHKKSGDGFENFCPACQEKMRKEGRLHDLQRSPRV